MVLDWFDAHLRNAPDEARGRRRRRKPSPTEEFWNTLSAPGGVAKARQMYDEAKRAGKHDGALSGERDEPARLSAAAGGQREGRRRGLQAERRRVSGVGQHLRQPVGRAIWRSATREEALRYAEKAIEMMPKDAEASDNLKKLVRESAEKKIKELRKQ